MYDLTVIIPTFKEEKNIKDIITETDNILVKNNLNGEILIVDDNSPDNTILYINEIMKDKPNVNLLIRMADHGLSQSVVAGFNHASSDIFIVIDADFSHPIELIPVMYNYIKSGNDLVIGSRYMEGGGIKKWPIKRRILSLGATFMGRIIFPTISDPISGFFAIKKHVIINAPLKPKGYKILMEVLGKGNWITAKEIPYEFIDREIGSSKLNLKILVEYIQQVVDIIRYKIYKKK